jgi:peptidoglycan/xylan/chitin deacetylase (PgdA/CDA1 family)
MWEKYNLLNTFVKEHNIPLFSYIEYNGSNTKKQACYCYNINDPTDLSYCIPDLIIYNIPNMNIKYIDLSFNQFDYFKIQYINYCNKIQYSATQACWFGNLYLYNSEHSSTCVQTLFNLTDLHPNLINCNNIVQCNNDYFRHKTLASHRYNILAAHFTIEYMMSFKYFIYINTDIFSGILKWILMSKRPVLLVESCIGEYYTNELIPYKHYIPIKRDLSNLIQQIELLNSDKTLCDYIAETSFEFMNKEFNYNNILFKISNYNNCIQTDPEYQNINQIHLTFDDGPDHVFTPILLDVLTKYNAKCSFFVLGTKVKQYPDIIKRMHMDGHTVGIHGWNHDAIINKPDSMLEYEIKETANLIYMITNKYPTLYRPPYGQINAKNVLLLEQTLNLRIIMGDIDSGDASCIRDETQIINTVLSQVYNNSIVVFHDSSQLTVNAIAKLLSINEHYCIAAL